MTYWLQMDAVTNIVAILFVSLFTRLTLSQPICKQGDFQYEYTQCDTHGQRWRVTVPNKDCNIASNTDVPRKATPCDMECKHGYYLNKETEECTPCAAGTYSSGNSVRYDDWDKLPMGFTTQEETFMGMSSESGHGNCSQHAWTPQGLYIAIVPGNCISILKYSTTLVKAGSLTFDYQFPSSEVLFHISIQNNQCQALEDENASKMPATTLNGQWKSFTVSLKTGFNVISWRAMSFGASMRQSLLPILVRKVYISGVSFSSDCAKCPAGYYSDEGSEICLQCPINTYSGKGASNCTLCDLKTEYSDAGATVCSKRSPCKVLDYYSINQPCLNGKTNTTYQWVQPMICDPDLLDSVHLQPDIYFVACHPCNRGMHLVNQSCTYCPRGQMSDGIECTKCEPTTYPNYELMFENWREIPADLNTICVLYFTDGECHNDTKWLPMGDYLLSHFARGDSAYLMLQMKVDGFRTTQIAGGEDSSYFGEFLIIFETDCGNQFCQLILLSDETGSQDIIHSWEYSQKQTKFKYNVKNNASCTFTVAFQNTEGKLDRDTDYQNTFVKIYSIQLTNTLNGGATSCTKCPKGINQDGCIPCEKGHYIETNTTTCIQCPAGTVVSSNHASGAESCKPCGVGLKAFEGSVCLSDGRFVDDNRHQYDMSNLSDSFQFISGSMLFTASGTRYYHGYNISLFGSPDKAQVTCESNFTKSDNTSRESRRLVAKICRTTLVPDIEEKDFILTTQPISLGDHLVEIVHNQTVMDKKYNYSGTIKDLYTASGFNVEDIDNDIQVHFVADVPTRACPTGRHTIVSLRCDFDKKGVGDISLPPKCPYGTCDGCTFHFMWSTIAACPLCEEKDYKKVVGECIKGYQTIHYFPPSTCLFAANSKTIEVIQQCTMSLQALPLIFQVGIPAVLALAFIFFIMVCFFWRKNKRLEYRYMKLVEGSGGDDGDLPAVDSCALEDGETDEFGDSVQISSNKGARFFKKFSNKMKKDDAFESAVLSERMPLT